MIWAIARQFRDLESLATLVALVLATVGVLVLGVHVEQVGDIATIPRSLPAPVLPDLGAAPRLVVGAIAVSLVALAQATGIAAAVPNPDGLRASASCDFLARVWPTWSAAGFRRCRWAAPCHARVWRPVPGPDAVGGHLCRPVARAAGRAVRAAQPN